MYIQYQSVVHINLLNENTKISCYIKIISIFAATRLKKGNAYDSSTDFMSYHKDITHKVISDIEGTGYLSIYLSKTYRGFTV